MEAMFQLFYRAQRLRMLRAESLRIIRSIQRDHSVVNQRQVANSFFFFFFFYLPPACSVQDQPWGRGRCHPFCRSRSHLEEADDTGTPPAVTEAGFERMTLVLREMCLTHLTTTARSLIVDTSRQVATSVEVAIFGVYYLFA